MSQKVRVTLVGTVIKDPITEAKPGAVVLKLESGKLISIDPQTAEIEELPGG